MRYLNSAGGRIFVAEHDFYDAVALHYAFERSGLPGGLTIAADGVEAMRYLTQAEAKNLLPSLLILDWDLPVLNGHEVLSWLREQPRLRDLPVVVWIAGSDPKAMESALALGASECLERPGDSQHMERLLRRLHSQYLASPLRVVERSRPAGLETAMAGA